MARNEQRGRLWELAALFVRLGATAFGGPAAHVAMMRDEVVSRRRWLNEQRFLDLLGATNLIPGPNSTEMAIHIGLLRAGWPGLIVAGASFILPAMLIVLFFAWAYVNYGSTPAGEGFLYGIEPVVIAIVVQAVVRLGRTAIGRSPLLVAVGIAAFALYLAGLNELVLLVAAGLVVLLVRATGRLGSAGAHSVVPLLAGSASLAAVAQQTPVELWRLFLQFLKFGAVVYGSGYVLFAFLEGDLVDRLGWLTEQQLVDALAIGQVTPGPVFTTATFIGYVLGGIGGALLATLGIFLPGFVFVALLQPLVRLMRRSTLAGEALDGVNVSAVGLMAGVTWQLGRQAIVDVPTALIAIAAVVILFRFRLNSGWLVLAGAALGLLVTSCGEARRFDLRSAIRERVEPWSRTSVAGSTSPTTRSTVRDRRTNDSARRGVLDQPEERTTVHAPCHEGLPRCSVARRTGWDTCGPCRIHPPQGRGFPALVAADGSRVHRCAAAAGPWPPCSP